MTGRAFAAFVQLLNAKTFNISSRSIGLFIISAYQLLGLTIYRHQEVKCWECGKSTHIYFSPGSLGWWILGVK